MPDDGGTFAPVVQLQAELVLHALAERSKLHVFFGHAPDANGRSVLAIIEEHVEVGVLAGGAVVGDEGEIVRVQAVF